MRTLLATPLAVAAAGPASAHPGHLAGAAGHNHWVAGAAIGLAVGIGLWQTIRDRRRRKADPAGDETQDTGAGATPQEG